MLLATAMLNAQDIKTPQIHITSQSTKEVMPDWVAFEMTIEITDENAKTAMNVLLERKKILLGNLTNRTKIKEDSIKSISFNTYQRYYNPQKNEKIYYVARETMRLVISADTQKTSELLGLITDAIPEIKVQLQPQISPALQASLDQALMEEVVAKARKEALIIAKASGYAMVNIFQINYHPGNRGGVFRASSYEMKDSNPKSVPDYQFSKETLNKEMSFVFNLYH